MMFTALVSVAVAASSGAAPHWQSDYRQALTLAAQQGKPMAVVLGRGEAGWDALVSEATLSAAAPAAARDAYVWLYVDTATDRGRKLAADFRADGPALILSDRGGNVQAFRHQGRLSGDSLKTVLTRYSEPAREVRRTETHPSPIAAPVYGPVRPNCASCGTCPSCH